MATITQNSAGNWKALIRKRGWPTTVKTFRRKRDARDWARRIEDEMVRGVYVARDAAERLTLQAALGRYYADVSVTKSIGAVDREKSTGRPLIEKLGRHSLASVTPQLVAEYRDERLKTRNRFGRAMSASQVRLELALLSHLFTVAIQEWGVGLTHNPVKVVRKPKVTRGRNRRLTAEEEQRLLVECRAHSNPMLAWIVQLALETGMRRGEIVGLRRGQIDLTRRVARVPETKNGEIRTVPLTREAARVLEEAIEHPIRPIDTDLIFWGDGKRRRSGERKPYDFADAWEMARERAAVPDLRFHDLRHEAVSRLVERGLSDQEVAAISGHKTMQMLRRYTHLRAEDLVARLDALGAG